MTSMKSYKTIFSKNNEINFNDYLKNKKGIEIIKNIQSKSTTQKVLERFLSYQDFILLTKTYFQYSLQKNVPLQIAGDMYHSNSTFVMYQDMLSHMEDCHHCKYCKNIFKLYDCSQVQNMLHNIQHDTTYSYNKKNELQQIYFPATLDLKKWCVKCREPSEKQNTFFNYENTSYNHMDNHIEHINDDHYYNDDDCKDCRETTSSKGSGCGCSSTHQKDKPIYNCKVIYPSQNTFVSQNINTNNKTEQIQRMNAFSVYPNIKNCYRSKVNDVIEFNHHNNETKHSTCGSKYGLCGKTKPLFIISK